MAQLALKGQDTALAIMRAGNIEATLTEIVSFNATFKFTKLVQRYLGETTIRPDEIFEGVEGKCKLHLYTDDFMNYISGIASRARRTTPSVVFNFVSTMNFPNGQSPTVSYPDVFFGDVPLDYPGGKEYLSMDLDWVCGEFDVTGL